MEDAAQPTPLVTDFLAASGLTYTHLHKLTPKDTKLQENDPSWLKPRGAEQRNEGLRWLRDMGAAAEGKEAAALEEAVVYFADDDNTYSLQLFEEVSCCRKVTPTRGFRSKCMCSHCNWIETTFLERQFLVVKFS